MLFLQSVTRSNWKGVSVSLLKRHNSPPSTAVTFLSDNSMRASVCTGFVSRPPTSSRPCDRTNRHWRPLIRKGVAFSQRIRVACPRATQLVSPMKGGMARLAAASASAGVGGSGRCVSPTSSNATRSCSNRPCALALRTVSTASCSSKLSQSCKENNAQPSAGSAGNSSSRWTPDHSSVPPPTRIMRRSPARSSKPGRNTMVGRKPCPLRMVSFELEISKAFSSRTPSKCNSIVSTPSAAASRQAAASEATALASAGGGPSAAATMIRVTAGVAAGVFAPRPRRVRPPRPAWAPCPPRRQPRRPERERQARVLRLPAADLVTPLPARLVELGSAGETAAGFGLRHSRRRGRRRCRRRSRLGRRRTRRRPASVGCRPKSLSARRGDRPLRRMRPPLRVSPRASADPGTRTFLGAVSSRRFCFRRRLGRRVAHPSRTTAAPGQRPTRTAGRSAPTRARSARSSPSGIVASPPRRLRSD